MGYNETWMLVKSGKQMYLTIKHRDLTNKHGLDESMLKVFIGQEVIDFTTKCGDILDLHRFTFKKLGNM